MSKPDPFSPQALRDLCNRWKRLNREAGASTADRFLDAVQQTTRMLQDFPGAGMLCEVASPRLSGMRRFPVTLPFGRWLIVYLVRSDGILVLRVLHSAQDWPRLFR